MPRRIGELTETGTVAEMRAELRRLRRGFAAIQSPLGEYDEFTLASSTDSAHTLTYIPSPSLIPIACLNGLPGRYGTDYTVSFTTGIVTWSATKVAGDILSVFYQTTGDLIALSGPGDTGTPPTFRSKTTAGGAAGTVDPTIVLPVDVVAGDLLILAWASFYPPGGDPTGWTRALLTTATGGTNPAGVGCWYKTAVSADAGATVHIPLGVGSDYYTLAAVAYHNCSGVRSVVTSVGSAGVTSYATPASTASANDTVVSVWLMEAGASGGLSGFTLDAAVAERVRVDWGNTFNEFSHVGIGDETGVAGGATSPRTAAWATASSWASLTFVLQP